MDEGLIEYILKKSKEKGADDVVVNLGESTSSQIKFVHNKIVTIKNSVDSACSIFLVKDKKVVETLIQDLSTKNIDNTITKLIKFANISQPNPNYVCIAQGPFKYKKAESPDKKLVNIGDKTVDLLETGINSALSAGANRTAGTITTEVANSILGTSNNVFAKDFGASIAFSIRAFAEKDASGHGVSCSTTLKDFNPTEAGTHAGEIAKSALNPQLGIAGKYDIVFEPLAFAGFLEHTMDSASIFSVEAGFSFFANKLNKQVANNIVNLNDHGYINGGLGSGICDAEGVPTQNNTVIKDGVLKTYLHNSSTAARYNTKTTANAGLISPNPTNIVLAPGKLTQDELIKSIKHGLLVTNLWYTRFQNYSTGDFSTIPRDGIFLIEDGKITKSIKDIRISDNMLNLLNNISGIAKNQQQIVSWEVGTPTFTPSVLVKNVNVTKSTQ